MKNKKEKKEENPINKLENLDLGKILEKKRKRKRIIFGIVCVIAIIIGVAVMTYRHFYGNEKHLRADITISSSSKLYSNSEPENVEDIGEGALFILYIEGIKRDDFLAQYEVMEISINDEIIDLNTVTYRHLNNALSIRMHSTNYTSDGKGNVVEISVKEKKNNQKITKRLYNITEVI